MNKPSEEYDPEEFVDERYSKSEVALSELWLYTCDVNDNGKTCRALGMHSVTYKEARQLNFNSFLRAFAVIGLKYITKMKYMTKINVDAVGSMAVDQHSRKAMKHVYGAEIGRGTSPKEKYVMYGESPCAFIVAIDLDSAITNASVYLQKHLNIQ